MISPLLLPAILRVWWKCRPYEPVRVTPASVARWLSQYEPRHRRSLLLLLSHVIFLDRSTVLNALVEGHRKIERALSEDGISPTHIVYVQVGDAASSSPVMLNMLRDAERFERRKIPVLDSKDVLGISELTTRLNRGAIVYVDDFSGSGRQFLKARKFTSQYIAGSFSEFFLSAVICEEAMQKIGEASVVPIPGLVHSRSSRPLDETSALLSGECRKELLELGRRINPDFPLGFKNLATNVVLYRNAPNSTPLLLRGSMGQTPFTGVLPAILDLPISP
jgi:hypothetical protein